MIEDEKKRLKSEYNKIYREKNKERLRKQQQEWGKINRSWKLKKHKEYYVKNKDRFRKNGKEYYIGIIKNKKRSFIKKLREIKDAPCMDCGRKFHSACMDFDHVRGEKKMMLCKMASSSEEVFMAELAKCDIVCANCHRVRTKNRRLVQTDIFRLRWVLSEIKDTPCMICGLKFPPECMDFDHREPNQKKFNIGRDFGSKSINSKNLILMFGELDKCDIICHCCHRYKSLVTEKET